MLEQLDGEPPDLVVCFASPHFVGALDDMTAALARLLEPGVLVGMAAAAVIGGAVEAELVPALSVWAGCLDGAVTPVGLRMVATPDGPAVSGWPDRSREVPIARPRPARSCCWRIPSPSRSRPSSPALAETRPELQVIGGMASAAPGPAGTGSRSTGAAP